MSSLHIFIFYIISINTIVDNYFTQKNYDLWCQENVLSNSLFIYSDRIPIGIYHQSDIKSIVYYLLNDNTNGLFDVKTKYLGDFYFFILHITRPLDINREYQNNYQLRIQANISTNQGNVIDHADIHLYIADSNDNDVVFDMDIYEKTISEPYEIPQLLMHFHASDADEIHYAQILYELSSFADIFSLHPFTGELYLISNQNLQSIYEFDIYAYDRQRKSLLNNHNYIKTKAHVKLLFPQNNKIPYQLPTISNQIIEFKQIISSYKISFFQNSEWNLVNIHQPILTVNIFPYVSSYAIFLLNNSSLNSRTLFVYKNKIYLNNSSYQQYNLQLLICFSNRHQCQYTNYDLIPLIDDLVVNFKPIQTIFIEENLPVHSFLSNIQLEFNHQPLMINYKLLNYQHFFHLHPSTGILRLNKSLKNPKYILAIQASIDFYNKSISIQTNIEINSYEINKCRPKFSNETLIEVFQLPYQFQAFDYDQNNQTNGRITYRLANCFYNCPFQINPNNGILTLKKQERFIRKKIYYVQIIAFDWGVPISFESSINVKIELSKRLNKRALGRRLNKVILPRPEGSIYSPVKSKTIYLNIGFKENSKSYYLSEDTSIDTMIEHLNIEYDSFPLLIDNEKDNLFFYIINDTSVPFIIDQNKKFLKLINSIDREKQNEYIFEIELKLKLSYIIKLEEIFEIEEKNLTLNIQYSNKYYQKMLIKIYVNDINDNIPRCQFFHKHIYLNENYIQTNIYHVKAYDPDPGENGTISYSLLDYNQYFMINSYTGEISLIQPIDHEQIPYLMLHIITTDQGQQPQLQSVCMTLHITIKDLNDNNPKFSLVNYFFEIFSDLPQETIFGQVHAIDADSTDKLIYSIDLNPYVKINQNTGHLRLKSNLNQHLNLTVYVSDGLHQNQTWIYIPIKPFLYTQQPILLSQPAYSLIIDQSIPIGTIITNIYHRLELSESSVDFIEIINDGYKIPFSIDQQGSLHLIDSLTASSKSSYWISVRLTRYRAHPPHSFVHIHISIREDNYYLPQCVNIYQNIKVYDYSIRSSLARIQARSFYNDNRLQYSIIDTDRINEKIFSIDNQTGFIQLLPTIKTNQLKNSDYLLAIRALDAEHQVFVDCYGKIYPIHRRQLIPKFFYSSVYTIDLAEISFNSQRLRQRLFQVIALLDDKIYDNNLELRYRIIDSHQNFIINQQTGYIAARKSLLPHITYQFTVEAFTILYLERRRIVSSRVNLSIKVQVLPNDRTNSSILLHQPSIINIGLLTTTKVGSSLFKFKQNTNSKPWFILISQIEYTKYFHINFQTGELILIRPIKELINQTSTIELNINITYDWMNMNTIKVIIHIKKAKFQLSYFSQTDYYSSISKTIPIGIEIARLTIKNPLENCTYHIHSYERIKSKNFFHINSHTGSISIVKSLEKSVYDQHLLTIMYYCKDISHIAYTRLHINILDKRNVKNSYRFRQENYLIVFETALIKQQRKYLMNFELISGDSEEKRIKPDVQIIEGDPLGLFSIDTSNQSLYLVDESRSRSYIYPIRLTILDTSQNEFINCTVTLFISNLAIQFTCPTDFNPSPYLFTYESIPKNSIDLFSGQQYNDYQSLTIRAYDSLTPLDSIECFINKSEIRFLDENIDFTFEKDIYYLVINSSSSIHKLTQELIQLTIKNRVNYSSPFDITYQFIHQNNFNPFQLDKHTGTVKYSPKKNSLLKYSFLILAKYKSLLTLTRLCIDFPHLKQPFYKFQVYKPFINNYTIGYIKDKNLFNKEISSIFSIDYNGRLFIKNERLIERNFYDLIIENLHVQINIFSKNLIQCSLNKFDDNLNEKQLIGFIEILNFYQNKSRKKSFRLLNYNHLFKLDSQHGLLYYQKPDQIIENDLQLLIDIDYARCFITIRQRLSRSYLMIRKGNQLKMGKLIEKNSGQFKLDNGTFIDFDLVSNQAPIFSRKSYTFYLNISNNINEPIYVGQIAAQPYNIYRSHLVYQFVTLTKCFIINIENGIIKYIPNKYYDKTKEHIQILVRDLIYQQNITINVTIHIFKSELISSIYYQTIPANLPLGSVIFQPNISNTQNLQYSLKNSHSNLFKIDFNTGQVTLTDYLTDSFYSLQIHISPINQILIVKLTIVDANTHSPTFRNLPSNLTISCDDTFVTKLSAYDLDLFDNQNLKYYLLDPDQRQFFSIDQTSGIITLTTPPMQTYLHLKIGVNDGHYLTTTNLSITIFNYSKNVPQFSSDEYSFEHNSILGPISAYDPDPNDQLIYQLYLEPDGIKIDPYSGIITLYQTDPSPSIEFYASVIDRAKQMVYTKIKIFYPVQPKFTSNVYYITLHPTIHIPSEIFQFYLVDSFNQPLSSTKFQINQTNSFEIYENKLILKENISQSEVFTLNIYGYWKNYTCQTSIQIKFSEQLIKLDKKFYEFSIEKSHVTDNYFIHRFNTKNSSLNILSTPLTQNNCTENFYLKSNELYFKKFPIRSNFCFFELKLFNQMSISTSQIKILFLTSNNQPKFSSKNYDFYTNSIRIFAKSFNPIRYKLQTNTYGLIMNQTNGIISFKYGLDRLKDIDRIQLDAYAIDQKTNANDTALIHIRLNRKQEFRIPEEISICPHAPVSVSEQSLPGTIIQEVQHPTINHSTDYYILSGDKYGLFAINNLGQLYLISSMLDKTSEIYFELTILLSSLSISYCRTNISIIRSPKWSHFICPIMPIEWLIEEESPIGTSIGNIKDILLLINNNNNIQLIDHIQMKLNPDNDLSAFHLNTSTGLITSKSRLDYEQKTSYSFSILLEPNKLNCSLLISIKLININDNSKYLDKRSLKYTIHSNHIFPFYIGRIHVIDPDRFYSNEYKYFLKYPSSDILIDSITGSIILLNEFNQRTPGEKLQYVILVIDYLNQINFTDILIIHIDNYVSLFNKDVHRVNITKSTQPGTIIYQIISSNSAQIIYNLEKNSSSIFSIEKSTGIIRLNNYLSSIINNYTLVIEGIDEKNNLIDRTTVFISIINDDHLYFNLENIHHCFINNNQMTRTNICTVGKNSADFIYYLSDPTDFFDILPNNGTVINRKTFDYKLDQQQFYVIVTVRDRNKQSIILSSINLTIHLRKSNDLLSKFSKENFTTLLYLYYPVVNTIVYKFEKLNQFTYEIMNDTYANYILHLSSNTTELILNKSIFKNHEDNLIIHFSNNNHSFDLNIRLIYHLSDIKYPKLLSQTINGYIKFEENFSNINLGRIFIQNHSEYQFIHLNLLSKQNFLLKQLSNNQIELYLKRYSTAFLQEFTIDLTILALTNSIPQIDFSKNFKFFYPAKIKSQPIHIQLWSINREMLDRTIGVTININSNITSEQFLHYNLSLIRQTLAYIIDVNIDHVHIYTFKFKQNSIELLIAIFDLTTKHYIQKKYLYNVLKSSKTKFENILFNQCQINSCENNGICTSYISLVSNRYEYIYLNAYHYLIPIYQWNTKCLCQNSYYGENCQFKQETSSPCSSNPCLSTEKCVELSSTLYSCQCKDDLCYMKMSLECMNINSPTCRDSSNTLTFDGYSSVQMNLTINSTEPLNIRFSFRTQLSEGKLLKLIYLNKKTNAYDRILIQIIDGYLKIELNEKILLQINDLLVHDSLWHDIDFSIDFIYSYYLLRFDDVFSDKLILSEKIYSNNLIQLILGDEFHGCLGNFSLNNQFIDLVNEKTNASFEYIGTDPGCQLPDIIHNDICSTYNPCYYGGKCITDNNLSFSCNCSSERFTGRQCQLDLYPCQSHPCNLNEECISSLFNSNQSYICIPSLKSKTKYLYIGLIFFFSLCSLFILLIYFYYYNIKNDKSFVSRPLLIRKSSTMINQTDGTMQTLLKTNYYQKQMINDNRSCNSLNRLDPNNEQLNKLIDRNSTDYDNTHILQTTELFDFSSSPTQFFNNSDNRRSYQMYINSVSNLTEHFLDESDIDLSDTSNDSSIVNRNYKHRYFFSDNHTPTSTLSLPKASLYAKIVKTPKVTNSIEFRTSTPTSFLKENTTDNDTNHSTINRFRHASDSDLLNGKKSIKFSSFFQTDV